MTSEPVVLVPWSEQDLALLPATNTPEMTRHLGGPESAEKLSARQERYLRAHTPAQRMFRVALAATGEPVGSVGYWEREWQGERVYETGWGILPDHQGRGLATAAVRLVLAEARAERTHRFVHAYPNVANQPSNALCRSVGFTLRGEYDFEYPPGHFMRCNDWAYDLTDLTGLADG